jgi:hypothetical protein
MLKVPVVKGEALAVLNQIRERKKCTLLVLENEDIAYEARLRENSPGRQVAFLRNASVMDDVGGYEAVNAQRAAGAVVIALTPDFKVSATLRPDEADIVGIEDAFVRALIDS